MWMPDRYFPLNTENSKDNDKKGENGMRLLIKQRVFALTDTYDVYDGRGTSKYFVKNELFSILHRIHVKDAQGHEVGQIRQNFTLFRPEFQVWIGGRHCGSVRAQFSLLRPKYSIDYMGWRCDGDIFGWNYTVYRGMTPVMHISKKLLSWGDTYVIDIDNPEDEIMGLMLVIAIDAANCSQNSSYGQSN